MTKNLDLFHKEQHFTGTFRVHSIRSLISSRHHPYTRLKIEDIYGSAIAYGWSGSFSMDGEIHDMDICYLEGRSRLHQGRWLVDIFYIAPVRNLLEINIARLLPKDECPRPELLHRLDWVVNSILNPQLKQLLNSVLLDKEIIQPFLSVPASMKHHHSHEAGLLLHSIECAEIVMNSFPVVGIEKELGVIAALLHDISKTRTMTNNHRKTTLGYVVEHDLLTLEVLAAHLRELDRTWPDGATALRYLLTWKNSKHSLPLLPVAEAVQAADRVSSALDARKLAYFNVPEWKRFCNLDVGGPVNRFWLPSPANDTQVRGTQQI